jgi:12-oxophytodienoic acid reductase
MYFDQFLKDSVNDRTDKYGGSFENRCRHLIETIQAVGEEIGQERVAVKISPFSDVFGASDSDPLNLGLHLVKSLNNFNLLYVHCLAPHHSRTKPKTPEETTTSPLTPLREAYKGSFFVAGGYNQEDGNEAISSGNADAVVYGQLFLANPDLPKRFELHSALNKPNHATYYTPDPVVGYTDYPFLEDAHGIRV